MASSTSASVSRIEELERENSSLRRRVEELQQALAQAQAGPSTSERPPQEGLRIVKPLAGSGGSASGFLSPPGSPAKTFASAVSSIGDRRASGAPKAAPETLEEAKIRIADLEEEVDNLQNEIHAMKIAEKMEDLGMHDGDEDGPRPSVGISLPGGKSISALSRGARSVASAGSEAPDPQSTMELDSSGLPSLAQYSKVGFLYKQGESNKRWKKRWFVLKDGRLLYFESPKDSAPLGSIELADATLCVPPSLPGDQKRRVEGYPFCILKADRNYWIMAESDSTRVAWLARLRGAAEAASLRGSMLVQRASSTTSSGTPRESDGPWSGTGSRWRSFSSDGDDPETTRDELEVDNDAADSDDEIDVVDDDPLPQVAALIHDGYLYKQGQTHKRWSRRWFELRGTRLSYFKGRKDQKPKGYIDLTDSRLYIPPDAEQSARKGKFRFNLITTVRAYALYDVSQETMEEWMRVIENVIQNGEP